MIHKRPEAIFGKRRNGQTRGGGKFMMIMKIMRRTIIMSMAIVIMVMIITVVMIIEIMIDRQLDY